MCDDNGGVVQNYQDVLQNRKREELEYEMFPTICTDFGFTTFGVFINCGPVTPILLFLFRFPHISIDDVRVPGDGVASVLQFQQDLLHVIDIISFGFHRKSALVYPTPCLEKVGEATFGSGKSIGDEVQKNPESDRMEDDVKDVMEPNGLSLGPALLPTEPLGHGNGIEKPNGFVRENKEDNDSVRPLRDVASSFADENASIDQRAHDLSVINESIENTSNYMRRCCLRKDLMSLGVLKGVISVSKTKHPALSRELQRLVECEARDRVIQEASDDALDRKCPMDLLFDWFDASKEPQELARKQCLLRILVRNRNLTEPMWAHLLLCISKVLDVQAVDCGDEKSKKRESNAKKLKLADILRRRRSNTTNSSYEYDKKQSCSFSGSPAPSDPNHGERLNSTALVIEKNSFTSDDLLLKTVAPMPKMKTRPRSISRHRATTLALIPPNERNSQTNKASLVVSATASVPPTSVVQPVQSSPVPPATLSASAPPVPSIPNLPPVPPPPLPPVLEKIQIGAATPPPPPPPPPGIFGQPALSLSTSLPSHCSARSDEVYPKMKRTYSLFWQAVSQHDITNVHTVWNEYPRPEFGVEERDHVLSLFERVEPNKSRFLSEQKGTNANSSSEIMFQLPQQKALNLEILLAKLRPRTVMDLVVQLESNNIEEIPVELLSSLLKYFPTDEEMLMYKKVIREEVKRNCDVFCWEVASRPTLKIKLELAIAREHILQDLARYLESTKRLRTACDALRSPVLIRLLHKCLQYGNFINQGTAISRAVGFSFSSLLSVLTAKGRRDNAPNFRIVDLLAQYVEFDVATLQGVVTSLQSARSVVLDDVEAASKELSSSVSRLQQHLVTKGAEDVSLLQAYQPFLEDAQLSSSNLAAQLQDLRAVEASLQLFLCANSMKLEGIVSTTLEALAMLSESIKTRSRAKLRSSTCQSAGRESLTLRRRSLQPKAPSFDEMRQKFLQATNQ
uniref:FH2 domain-containing protein n=1 Tax=Angiostrongylus cantonensis TaxID=6313 RepID=A0A0K0DDF3_ANGCA